MLPFLVNMGRLFESFIAEWLRQNLPEEYHLVSQETVQLDARNELHFNVDLVLNDSSSGVSIAVLDTKYKVEESPSPADLQQVVAYAVAKDCRRAALIYPVMPRLKFNSAFGAGDIHVRTFEFGLEGDLNERGRECLDDCIEWINS
jgi:5-methylcytosine-specific restriction enzyme subunit McrC